MANKPEKIEIRPYHSTDLVSLYKICLRTAYSGNDASSIYNDPDLVGHYYVAPYAVLEPEVAFVLTVNNIPSGYILGTKNSEVFFHNCEANWFPLLREQYPIPREDETSPDSNIIRLIHKGQITFRDLVDYPAHLHIDLLPIAQGKGMGRKLMDMFINKLKDLEVSALHLRVGKQNEKAINFYRRMGFNIIKDYEKSIAFGMKLKS